MIYLYENYSLFLLIIKNNIWHISGLRHHFYTQFLHTLIFLSQISIRRISDIKKFWFSFRYKWN